MTPPRTLLAIFAHPDDEVGAGSTLAHYADAGARTVLICASRGEAATIFCADCATPETLPQVRTEELECACRHLGIRELRWLDWPDGKISGLPRDEAVATIVRHIRAIRPEVIITHPQNGLYPHPDHLAIWEIVREAFSAATDPERWPEAGMPWAPSRLFVRALPQSIFEAAPALQDFRVDLNGELLPFYGTPDAEIDMVMHVEPWVERRMAAWACHMSQHNPKGFSSVMPDGMRLEMAAHEAYLLAAARAPLPEDAAALAPDGDLFLGLPETPAADGDRSEAEAAAFEEALVAELAWQKGLSERIGRILDTRPDDRVAAMLRGLAEQQQEVIYRLAAALRHAGRPAASVEANRPAGRMDGRTEGERLAGLRDAISAGAGRLASRAEATPGRRAFWEDLRALAEEELEVLA